MIEIVQEFAVKVLGRTVPFLVGMYYKPNKLAKKIKIQIRGAGEGIVFDCGELPSARAWLEITNLSPFPVLFDRIYGHFWYGTRLAPFYSFKRVEIQPSQYLDIFVEADLSPAHAEYIKRNKEQNMERKLTVSAYVICKVNNFEIEREVQTNNSRLQNV